MEDETDRGMEDGRESSPGDALEQESGTRVTEWSEYSEDLSSSSTELQNEEVTCRENSRGLVLEVLVLGDNHP